MDVESQLPQAVLTAVTPRWAKQIGVLTVLNDDQVVSVQWIATHKIPQELSESIFDVTSTRRVERGSAEYHVTVEQVAENLLKKLP